jgi:FkbM family methyltransferase
MSFAGFFFKKAIKIYRKTLKPFRALHAALYGLAQGVLLPALEALKKFHTLKDDPVYFRIELLTGGYERSTVRWVRALVRPGMTAVDIGAHVGYYTRLLAAQVGAAGRVLAFEPNPRTFATLERNVEGCANVRPIQLALTDREGTGLLYDGLPSSGATSFYFDGEKRDWYRGLLADREISPRVLQGFPVTSYQVATTALDSYWSRGELPEADFIKMDIEGAEMSALQGMKGLIGSSPRLTMVMEYYPRGMELIGIDPLESLQRLRDLGFRSIRVIQKNGLVNAEDRDFMARLVKKLLAEIRRVNILCAKIP